RELVLVSSAAIALAAAIATQALGFSPELGAFMAGLLLAFTPYRTQLAGQFEPLRDLLMAIFFTTVGLGIHLGEVAPFLVPILIGWAHPRARRLQQIGPPPWTRPLARLLKVAKKSPRPAVEEAGEAVGEAKPAQHVIIAGFGPVGRNLAARLEVHDVPYTVV